MKLALALKFASRTGKDWCCELGKKNNAPLQPALAPPVHTPPLGNG
jgi:hypothetical protein